MTIPVIGFFNNKGGVGKTSLVYHLSWMFAESGSPVLAVDLDPQANLSAAFLSEDRLAEFWDGSYQDKTIYGGLKPLLSGTGDISGNPHIEHISENLWFLVGDLSLSRFEDELTQQWTRCLDKHERAFRVVSAFWRLMQTAASKCDATLILVDLGPNLGSINRSVLISTDYLVIPLAPDLFSIQGLKNLGPTVRTWREEWAERLNKNPISDLPLPKGTILPIGYIIMQHAVRLDRPVIAYERWAKRIPEIYAKEVLGEENGNVINPDPHCIGLIKHYRSLVPMAQEAQKPIFLLKSADGAIGSHAQAVHDAWKDFSSICQEIKKRISFRE